MTENQIWYKISIKTAFTNYYVLYVFLKKKFKKINFVKRIKQIISIEFLNNNLNLFIYLFNSIFSKCFILVEIIT